MAKTKKIKYKEMHIGPEENDGYHEDLTRIANCARFDAQVVLGYEEIDAIYHPQNFSIVIVSLEVRPNMNLLITFKTKGHLPPGLKHGTYTALFNDGYLCRRIPQEMYRT